MTDLQIFHFFWLVQYSTTNFRMLDVDTTTEHMAIVKKFGIKKVPHFQLYQCVPLTYTPHRALNYCVSRLA